MGTSFTSAGQHIVELDFSRVYLKIRFDYHFLDSFVYILDSQLYLKIRFDCLRNDLTPRFLGALTPTSKAGGVLGGASVSPETTATTGEETKTDPRGLKVGSYEVIQNITRMSSRGSTHLEVKSLIILMSRTRERLHIP